MWKALFGGKRGGDDDVYRPRMPEVDVPPNLEDIFRQARESARGATPASDAHPPGRHLVAVTPGRMLFQVPCPAAGSMPREQVASIENMISPATPRAIAVIAYTQLEAIETNLSKAIPFAGLLLGCAYIGHAVWAFEGHASALAAGCREADFLFIDSGMVPHLPEDWAKVVGSVMRHKEVYVHDRATFKLSRVAVA